MQNVQYLCENATLFDTQKFFASIGQNKEDPILKYQTTGLIAEVYSFLGEQFINRNSTDLKVALDDYYNMKIKNEGEQK